jgi:hypothetical protein
VRAGSNFSGDFLYLVLCTSIWSLVFSFDMGIIRKEEVTQEVNNLLENKDNE